MKNFKPRKNIWRRLYESPISIVFLLALLIFFSWNIIQLGGKLLDTEENRKIAEEKVTELKERKKKTREEIELLKTDKGIEENIRERYGLVKEGEKVIIIVDENKDKIVKKEEESTFLNFLKNWFKK